MSGGTWTRVSGNFVAPNGANRAYFICSYANSVDWQMNDTLDGDVFMVVAGEELLSYSDGDSPDWIWNATPNNSTSTGPSL